MPTKPEWFYRQSGAICVREFSEGVEVLLVTSRRRKRWIVPKGIVERELTPAESAAKEAWEEAGVRGDLLPRPLGTYRYEKWGGTCTVEVFFLRVEEVADRWPESDRRRRWFLVGDAAEKLREPDLAEFVRRIPDFLAGQRSEG